MRADLRPLMWPASDLGEALAFLARRMGASTPCDHARFSEVTSRRSTQSKPGVWFRLLAARFGLEIEEVSVGLTDYEDLVRGGAPAVLRLPSVGRFLVLLRARGEKAQLLARDGTLQSLPVESLVGELSAEIECRHRDTTDKILLCLSNRLRRAGRIRQAVLRELASAERASAGWLVRLQPGSGFWTQLRQRGALRLLWASLVAHVVYYGLWLLSWWLIGRGALAGRIEGGWLLAWALLLATLVPLRASVSWCQGRFSIAAGAVLRGRLLEGALRLPADDVRHQGVGQILGRVIESEAVESMALAGGLVVLTASTEIAMACFVLASGAAPGPQMLALALILAGVAFLAVRYYSRRSGWTTSRLGVTHDLVERLVGHRTEVVQQAPELRGREEDRTLSSYLDRSRAMDRVRIWLATIPRAWLVLGFLAMAPSLSQDKVLQGRLAVSLGGLILVYRALASLVGGLAQLTSAHISWQRVSGIFRAAQDRTSPPSTAIAAAEMDLHGDTEVLTARAVSFRFPGQAHVAVRRCNLDIAPGDRVLIEGPSGGGKSTLAALLAGLRAPDSGLMLLNGIDHRSLVGEIWRGKVTAVPQFHENYVVSETFAFNVLMGRRWPPEGRDLEEAERVCRELGLGDLIDTMPGGMLQRVGEAGWKLSHGERSRLFIARSLVQDPELLIIDEGFGALDPESLRRAMECVLDRTRSLLVIAHP